MFVEYTLNKWGTSTVVDAAMLVVDELATNAVKATGVIEEHQSWTELTRAEFIIMRLLGMEASIRIEVWDSAPNSPALSQDADAVVKRGCYPTAHGRLPGLNYRFFPAVLAHVYPCTHHVTTEDSISPILIFSTECEMD